VNDYVVLKGLFDRGEMDVLNMNIKKGLSQSNDIWNAIQKDRKRHFKGIPLQYLPDSVPLIEKIINASAGIIHDSLRLESIAVIKSLEGNTEQGPHIDAGCKENRGCSGIVAIMSGTYMISYMGDVKINIVLEKGDVLLFTNAFVHGGGSYTVELFGEESVIYEGVRNCHYRLFFCWKHVHDKDNKTFTRIEWQS
jgi:hypothetical protein